MQDYLASKNIRKPYIDIAFDIVGTAIFSIAVQSFSAPNNIAPGGVTGISILANYLFGLPISVVSLLLNLPLLLAAWLRLGRTFALKTIRTVLILTVMLEICALFPTYTGDPILAALFGGVLEGIGLSLVLMRSSTTGGTDVASRLIQIKFPHIQVGKLMLMVDGFVLIMSAIVYKSIENALYGLLAIFTATRIIDSMLYGLDVGKVMMIVSQDSEKIVQGISDMLGRGCTLLDGKGSYTMEKRTIMLCAVKKSQFYTLKNLVHEIDPNAFMVALEANEIIGEGFKTIEQKDKNI